MGQGPATTFLHYIIIMEIWAGLYTCWGFVCTLHFLLLFSLLFKPPSSACMSETFYEREDVVRLSTANPNPSGSCPIVSQCKTSLKYYRWMIASYAQLCTSLALLCKTFSANVAILFSVPRVMVAGQLSPSYRVSGPSQMLIPVARWAC